jgi:hypothetical protein
VSAPRLKIAGVALAIAVTTLLSSTATPAVGRPVAEDRVVFTIKSPEITESSALAVSTVKPRLVYTINDSGDAANVYVLDWSTGDLVGTTTLVGVEAIDIEGIATGTDGMLVVADIGDNKADHSSGSLHLIPQPSEGDHQVDSKSVTVTYVDGPRDAESVLYDADTGRVYVVSKQFGGAKVYRSPPDVFSKSSAVLEPVAPAPGLATDATFLPSGDVAVIRTYLGAVAYRFPSWKKITDFPLPSQPQGESITAPRHGNQVWVGSEGENSQVLAVPLPDLQPDEPKTAPTTTAPTASTGSSTSTGDNEELKDAARVVIVGAAVALFVLILLGAFLYRRHLPGDD